MRREFSLNSEINNKEVQNLFCFISNLIGSNFKLIKIKKKHDNEKKLTNNFHSNNSNSSENENIFKNQVLLEKIYNLFKKIKNNCFETTKTKCVIIFDFKTTEFDLLESINNKKEIDKLLFDLRNEMENGSKNVGIKILEINDMLKWVNNNSEFLNSKLNNLIETEKNNKENKKKENKKIEKEKLGKNLIYLQKENEFANEKIEQLEIFCESLKIKIEKMEINKKNQENNILILEKQHLDFQNIINEKLNKFGKQNLELKKLIGVLQDRLIIFQEEFQIKKTENQKNVISIKYEKESGDYEKNQQKLKEEQKTESFVCIESIQFMKNIENSDEFIEINEDPKINQKIQKLEFGKENQSENNCKFNYTVENKNENIKNCEKISELEKQIKEVKYYKEKENLEMEKNIKRISAIEQKSSVEFEQKKDDSFNEKYPKNSNIMFDNFYESINFQNPFDDNNPKIENPLIKSSKYKITDSKFNLNPISLEPSNDKINILSNALLSNMPNLIPDSVNILNAGEGNYPTLSTIEVPIQKPNNKSANLEFFENLSIQEKEKLQKNENDKKTKEFNDFQKNEQDSLKNYTNINFMEIQIPVFPKSKKTQQMTTHEKLFGIPASSKHEDFQMIHGLNYYSKLNLTQKDKIKISQKMFKDVIPNLWLLYRYTKDTPNTIYEFYKQCNLINKMLFIIRAEESIGLFCCFIDRPFKKDHKNPISDENSKAFIYSFKKQMFFRPKKKSPRQNIIDFDTYKGPIFGDNQIIFHIDHYSRFQIKLGSVFVNEKGEDLYSVFFGGKNNQNELEKAKFKNESSFDFDVDMYEVFEVGFYDN